MAMGRRKSETQPALFVPASELPRTPAHPFYEKLNAVLAEHGFDPFVEELCQKFYAVKMGRPGLEPGKYFRMLFLGYFEGIDSERGIAWRAADSLSCGRSWGMRSMSRRQTIRRFPARVGSSTWKRTTRCLAGC